jgi:signal transduction histidine kinase
VWFWSHPRSLLGFTPFVVLALGTFAAVGFGSLAVSEIRSRSDAHAMMAAHVLGSTLAARLQSIPTDQRPAVIERAARRAGIELLLADPGGATLADATLHAPSPSAVLELLVQEEGTTTTQLGRVRYAVLPVRSLREPASLVVFVPAPETPTAIGPLVTSLGVLATLLVGVATLVALALARDVHADLDFVRARIERMSTKEAAPSGQPIFIRSADAVGALISAFNDLVGRFADAERRYRENLNRALSYDRDRSAFLAALSHELRTPLNAILGFTDVLLAEVDGPLSADARESLEVVRTSGRHLASLIDDVLDLSALESGQLRLTRSYVDAYSIAEVVVREALVTAQPKGLAVTLSGNHAAVWADPRRVRQILGNVVGNAVKFTQTGRVDVHVEHTGAETTTIVVSDTGPGIAPDDQLAIFEEYRQSGEERVRRSGTGLGLAITRRLVDMHRGSIALSSTLGVGSTFKITLPSESDLDRDNELTPLEPITVSRTETFG